MIRNNNNSHILCKQFGQKIKKKMPIEKKNEQNQISTQMPLDIWCIDVMWRDSTTKKKDQTKNRIEQKSNEIEVKYTEN